MIRRLPMMSYIHKYGHQVSLVLFLSAAIAAVINVQYSKAALVWLDDSSLVVAQINKIGILYEQIERDQHGYLGTESSENLALFFRDFDNLSTAAQELAQVASDDQVRVELAAKLNRYLMGRLAQMRERIDKRNTEALKSTKILQLMNEDNDLSGEMRNQLSEAKAGEARLLLDRKKALEVTNRYSGILSILAFVFASILAAISHLIIRVERKEKEQKAQQLSSVIEQMSDCLVVVDKDEQIIHANKAAVNIIGDKWKTVQPTESASAFGFFDPITGELFKPESLPIQKALSGADFAEAEVLVKNENHPDGIMVGITASVMKDGENNVNGVIAVFRDISKQKKSEFECKESRAEAIRTSKMKSEFLATISHEIRTPMNGIIGMATLLNETILNDQQKESVQIIKKSAESLVTLINGVLDISKIEAGRLELALQYFDLAEFLKNLVDMYRFSAAEKNLALTLNAPSAQKIQIYSDNVRLRQVMINLVGNAIKFTEQGSVEIRLSTKFVDDNKAILHFDIVDTGVGLTQSEMNSLFVRYKQTAHGEKKGGSGLGLAICEEIVRVMGGIIGVESNGKGSNFWFEIPVQYVRADFCLVPEKVLERSLFLGHVLIVEDQIVNQKVLAGFLRKLNLTCEIAKNGLVAIELIKRKHFDLVFMDCRMPEMDGYEATQVIRKTFSKDKLPIVALSAESSDFAEERCLSVGMNEFLIKPLDFEELQTVLRQYLRLKDKTVDPMALKQIREFSDADEDVIGVLLTTFEKVLPELLLDMEKQIVERDANRLKEVAHALKSSSLALGMTRVGVLCQTLEDSQIIDKNTEELFSTLRIETDRAVLELTRLANLDL